MSNSIDVSLELVVFVGVATLIGLIVRGLINTRHGWWPWVVALFDRYVQVELPREPNDLRPKPLTPVSQSDDDDEPLPVGETHPETRVRVVRSPATPGAPPSIPTARRTDGARGAHAENDGAGGARTSTAPPSGGAPSNEMMAIIRRIAQHKRNYPKDEKTATGEALGIKKSGTSQKWKEFSEAWDMLYAPLDDPLVLPADDPRSFVRNDDGSLTRIDASGQPIRR